MQITQIPNAPIITSAPVPKPKQSLQQRHHKPSEKRSDVSFSYFCV